MAASSREEFLSHVHRPRSNNAGPGSPTKSTMRYRWRELRHWAVEEECRAYWEALSVEDKAQEIAVPAGFWGLMELLLESSSEPLASESRLKFPFGTFFQSPHNIAIKGAGDAHAEIWGEGARLAKEPLGNADFLMVYDGKLAGAIELKTWWKVNEAEIEDVRAGREPLDGAHHGRLAIEQTYGYLVFDKITHGILTTFNSFVFLKRESPGILYMSDTFRIDSTDPTILKLLYFFSHLCAMDTDQHPEVNAQGNAIYLRSADKTTDKAPKIPDPNYLPPHRLPPPVADGTSTPRRSPRFHGPVDDNPGPDDEPLPRSVTNLAFLGCKGWRGTLDDGSTVFAKLWDGWKMPASYSEHEANVYYHLRDLWGTVVPAFIGLGQWGFCHILLLSYIECPMLYQVKYTPQIGRNIVKAFKQIHARGVLHGDVRPENILVRPDQSVVVIDFEMSELMAPREALMSEMSEVKHLLASFIHSLGVYS